MNLTLEWQTKVLQAQEQIAKQGAQVEEHRAAGAHEKCRDALAVLKQLKNHVDEIHHQFEKVQET